MSSVRLQRARESLRGLAIGDALGESLSVPDGTRRAALRLISRQRPWRWTDDTAMAISIVTILERFETIDADALAATFVQRWAAEPDRGYGGGAIELFTRVSRGAPWESEAPFDLWVAARHLGSYEDAIWTAITPLGDRDTNGAIVGGIVVLATGVDQVPVLWRAATEPLP